MHFVLRGVGAAGRSRLLRGEDPVQTASPMEIVGRCAHGDTDRMPMVIIEVEPNAEALEKVRQRSPPPKWSVVPRDTALPSSWRKKKGGSDGSLVSPKDKEKPQVLQTFMTNWMVTPLGQKKENLDDEEGSDGSISDGASFSSSEQPIAGSSMKEEACRRSSASSTSSERSSFDWKKIGRDAMESIKQRRASAVTTPLVWLNTGTPKGDLQEDDVSCSSRSASLSSEFLQPEISASIE